jgi:hypothetical protein
MRPRFLRVEFRVAFDDHDTLNACLEALVKQNLWQHRVLATHGRALPPLYQTRVVYRRDPPRKEWFRSMARVYSTGWGDCDDLAAIRAAEIRRAGGRAFAEVRRTPRPNVLHAVVTDGKNLVEDPTEFLASLGRYEP